MPPESPRPNPTSPNPNVLYPPSPQPVAQQPLAGAPVVPSGSAQPSLTPVQPGATPPQPGAPLLPVPTEIPRPPSHKKPVLITLGAIVGVVAVLFGGLLAYRALRPQPAAAPEVTTVQTSDLGDLAQALNTSLNEYDAALTGADTALNDKQGDLSE